MARKATSQGSQDGPIHKRPIIRHRDHLACIECRRAKVKCDRAVPCSQCTKRGAGKSCSYQKATTGFEAERERRRQAESRLEHLEHLVQQLSSGPTSEQDVATSNDSVSPVSHGDASATPQPAPGSADLVHNGATHWSAMLNDIQELRSVIGSASNGIGITETDEQRGHHENGGIDLLFGAGSSLNLEAVLATFLPTRQQTDRLVSAYFRCKAAKAPFLHQTRFQRLYISFWQNPAASPPLWVSLLFSVLHASSTSILIVGENTTTNTRDRYAVAAAQCLVIGKYHTPQPGSVEALLLFAQTKCFVSASTHRPTHSSFATCYR